ncbi:MAG: nitrate- and nitrite sensing domain-containing protein [Parvibaculaceae bacterium]|nr:nitrate- and nitrite sensing domain-containing protein [Parvibaculaceae bacterium]
MVKISNFSISTRIFFSAIIPLAAVIVLGAYVALDEFSRYRSLDKLQRLAEIAPEISAVVHVLQRERGMSAGYVSNNGKGVWRENLAGQQAATDMQLSTSLPILSNFPTEAYGEAVNENLSRALASIAQIDDIRSKTNGLRTPVGDIAAYYTSVNRALLDTISAIGALADNAAVKGQTIAYVNLLQMKERAGLERAMGAAGFGAGQFTADTYAKFVAFIGEQTAFENNFKAFSSAEMASLFNQLVTSDTSRKVNTFRDAAFAAGLEPLPSTMRGTQWFDAISQKIDLQFELETQVSNELLTRALAERSGAWFSLILVSLTVLAVLCVAGLLCWVFAGSIINPLLALKSVLAQLSEGSYEIAVDGTDRNDEIGSMARAVNVLRQASQEAEAIKADQERTRIQAEEEKKKNLADMANHVETSIGEMISTLAAASTELTETARNMSQRAEENSTEATSMSEAAASVTQSVETVASASTQLSAAIREVTEQITLAAKLTVDSQSASQQTEAQMLSLGDAADKIGSVVQLIQEIAEQTNLLALNATIESARAGEAGKGFAVVAAEVKDLANQTAKATEEISDHVTRVQEETARASTAMSEINAMIGEINQVTTAVSAAIEEQSSAIEEISRSAEVTAEMNRNVSISITKVKTGSVDTGASADQVLSSAEELSATSETLNTVVNDLVSSIRAS